MCICNLLEVWVVLEPRVHIFEGIFLGELVCKTDSKGQETIQVIWIFLMRLFEGQNGFFVLIGLLVELTQKFPRLVILFILLYFSFQAEHGLLHLTFFDKFSSLSDEVYCWFFCLLCHVRVFLFESEHIGITGHLKPCIFLPDIAPLGKQFIHFFHLAGLLHPLTHHLLHPIIS